MIGKSSVGRGQELVRVSVVAADDVMGQAVGPLLAVVVGAEREDLVRSPTERARSGLHSPVETTSRPVPSGLIRMTPPPDELDRPAVLAHAARDSLVADGDVEKPVHPQADSRRDVVVDAR